MRDISFSKGDFPAEPGESVTLTVVNAGALDHTFTLFAQVNATIPVSDQAALEAYNNSNPKITELRLSSNQQMQVQFTAPMVQGDYTYVCMITGHAAAGMFGVMIVSRAPPPPPPPTDTPGLDPLVLGIIIAVVVIVVAAAVVLLIRRRG